MVTQILEIKNGWKASIGCVVPLILVRTFAFRQAALSGKHLSHRSVSKIGEAHDPSSTNPNDFVENPPHIDLKQTIAERMKMVPMTIEDN